MQTDRLISRKGNTYKKLTTFSASGAAHITCALSHSAAAQADEYSSMQKHSNAISFHTVAGICTDTIAPLSLSLSLVSQRTSLLRRRRRRRDHQYLLLE